VQFSKQGVLLTDTKTALKAVFKYFEDNFGGATKRQAKTWKGALQQAAGEVTYALSHGLSGALRPATDFVRDSIIPSISRIGDSLGKVKWDKLLKGPLDTLGKLVNTASTIAGRFIDPSTRGGMAGELRTLGSSLLDAGRLLADGLLGVGQGLLKDLGATLEKFATNGVFPKIMETFWNMGKTVLFGFLDAGRLVLSGFSDRFKSDFRMLLESLPIPGIGKQETLKRETVARLANNDAVNEILQGKHGEKARQAAGEAQGYLEQGRFESAKKMMLEEAEKSNSSEVLRKYHHLLDIESMGALEAWVNSFDNGRFRKKGQAVLDRHRSREWENDFILSRVGNEIGDTTVRNAVDAALAKRMGWSGGSEKGIEFRTGAALGDLGKSLSETIGKIGDSVTLEHTREAGGRLAESFRDAGGRLQDFYDEQRRQAALRSGYNQADDRAGKRIGAIDEQIAEKEKEYRREERRIRRGRGSYDTLNSIGASIGGLQNERRRVEAWRKGNEKRYAQASNAASLRWQRERAERDIEELKSRADGLKGTDPSGYAAVQRRIAEKTTQRDTIVGQQTLMANAEKVKAIDRDIGKLKATAKGIPESAPQHDEIQKKIQELEQRKAVIKEESSNIRMRLQQQPAQQQQQQRQQQPQRPVSPGVAKGGDNQDKAVKAAFARIASNTGRTVDNMFAISRGVNGIISQNAQICKVLQQILAEA
jgi:hypothetical protein